jgi:hypothetical protein
MATSYRGNGRSPSRPAGRSSSGGSRGGGGGNNMMPIVIAGVAVVGVIVIAVALSGGKKEAPKADPVPAATAPVAAPPSGPPKPVLGPRPNLPATVVAKAKAIMPAVREASAQGKKLADEAHAAKESGDQQKWQDLLDEARDAFDKGQHAWNEVEDQVISFLDANPSQGWDANMLIDSFLKQESSEVQRLIDEPLSRIKKQSRTGSR